MGFTCAIDTFPEFRGVHTYASMLPPICNDYRSIEKYRMMPDNITMSYFLLPYFFFLFIIYLLYLLMMINSLLSPCLVWFRWLARVLFFYNLYPSVLLLICIIQLFIPKIILTLNTSTLVYSTLSQCYFHLTLNKTIKKTSRHWLTCCVLL